MGDGYSRLMARRNLRDDVNLAELSTWYNFANQLSTYGAPLGWKVSSSWGQSASYGAKGYGGEITKTWVEITPLRGQNGGNPVTYEFNGGGGGFMAPGWGVSGSAYNWPTRGEELYKGNLPLQSSNNALNPDELVGPAMLIDVNLGGAYGGPLPAGPGGGGSIMGLMFGVPGVQVGSFGSGLAVGAYKAIGWSRGFFGAAGSTGIIAGAILVCGIVSRTG